MYKPTLVFDKLRRKFFQAHYAKTALNIVNTSTLTAGIMPFTLLSMVHTKDVHSYLVAIKTFTRYVNPRRIVVICDPSITDADRATLSSHIPHLELREANEFTHKDIPRGGTWERLYAISEYSLTDYVVQLDSDTITMRSPSEVIHSIVENKGFVLGEKPNQTKMNLAETANRAKQVLATGVRHIQCAVEAHIDVSGLSQDAYYVRGCSGFTGFPKSNLLKEELLEFSKKMQAFHLNRWSEWGTEQITSNYLVANMPGIQVLPFPQYATPDVSNDSSVLVHYIGYLRFCTRKYQKDTLNAIRLLMNSTEACADVTQPEVAFKVPNAIN